MRYRKGDWKETLLIVGILIAAAICGLLAMLFEKTLGRVLRKRKLPEKRNLPEPVPKPKLLPAPPAPPGPKLVWSNPKKLAPQRPANERRSL